MSNKLYNKSLAIALMRSSSKSAISVKNAEKYAFFNADEMHEFVIALERLKNVPHKDGDTIGYEYLCYQSYIDYVNSDIAYTRNLAHKTDFNKPTVAKTMLMNNLINCINLFSSKPFQPSKSFVNEFIASVKIVNVAIDKTTSTAYFNETSYNAFRSQLECFIKAILCNSVAMPTLAEHDSNARKARNKAEKALKDAINSEKITNDFKARYKI